MADRKGQARIDPPSVDQDRAGAALAAVASFLGTRQIEPLAQQIEQRHAGVVQFDVPPHTVNGEADGEIHVSSNQCYDPNWIGADRSAALSNLLSIAICGGILRFQETTGRMIDAGSEASEKIILNQRDER